MSSQGNRRLELASFGVGLLVVGACAAAAFSVDKDSVWLGAGSGLVVLIALVAAVFAYTRRPPWLKRAVEWASVALGLVAMGSCVVVGGGTDAEGLLAIAGGVVTFGLLVATVFFVTRGVKWVGRVLEWSAVLGVVAGFGLLGACVAIGAAPPVGIGALLVSLALIVGVVVLMASKTRD